MLGRIDVWIGKTLFVPIIIRLCQRVGWSQYRLHRFCWFVAALIGLYFADEIATKVFFGIFALLGCLLAAIIPDAYPETSRRWFRMTVFGVMLVHVLRPDWSIAYETAILFAEYAATIRTIPPLESKEKRIAAKLARQRA